MKNINNVLFLFDIYVGCKRCDSIMVVIIEISMNY